MVNAGRQGGMPRTLGPCGQKAFPPVSPMLIFCLKVKLETLEEILHKITTFKDLRPKGRTALVADKDYAFGIGRMYDSLVEISGFPVEHRVFRDFKDAMKWLMQTA